MTQEDYQFLAEVFRQALPDDCSEEEWIVWAGIITRMADTFSHADSKFLIRPFLTICGFHKEIIDFVITDL